MKSRKKYVVLRWRNYTHTVFYAVTVALPAVQIIEDDSHATQWNRNEIIIQYERTRDVNKDDTCGICERLRQTIQNSGFKVAALTVYLFLDIRIVKVCTLGQLGAVHYFELSVLHKALFSELPVNFNILKFNEIILSCDVYLLQYGMNLLVSTQ